MTNILPTAPLLGSTIGLFYVYLRHGISPLEIWRTSSSTYKVVMCGSVLLSAAMLTLINPA